jgi:hypothetical protein
MADPEAGGEAMSGGRFTVVALLWVAFLLASGLTALAAFESDWTEVALYGIAAVLAFLWFNQEAAD